MLFFFVFIFISFSTAADVQNKCFKLYDYITKNEKQLTITVPGKMCDCQNDEKHNKFVTDNQKEIETLIFTDSVTSIGNKCFSQFSSVKQITFSGPVETIGKFSFYGTNIEEITIPQSVATIEESAFGNNKNLKKIQFAEEMNQNQQPEIQF